MEIQICFCRFIWFYLTQYIKSEIIFPFVYFVKYSPHRKEFQIKIAYFNYLFYVYCYNSRRLLSGKSCSSSAWTSRQRPVCTNTALVHQLSVQIAVLILNEIWDGKYKVTNTTSLLWVCLYTLLRTERISTSTFMKSIRNPITPLLDSSVFNFHFTFSNSTSF